MKIGFELEIEDSQPIREDIPCVSPVSEGSLRNGIEYVTSPLPDVSYASFLYDYLHNNITGNYTDRCGFHFHMDFTSRTPVEIIQFVKRYLKIERTLFRKYPDLFRSNNNFCNLLIESQNELDLIRKSSRDSRADFYCIISNWSKYTALNLKSLYSINTIEFRAAKAGLTSEEITYIFQLFEQLYNLSAEIPLINEVTEADLIEADSIIQLLDTPITNQDSPGPYMEEHFSIPVETLSREAIINHIRGIQ